MSLSMKKEMFVNVQTWEQYKNIDKCEKCIYHHRTNKGIVVYVFTVW